MRLTTSVHFELKNKGVMTMKTMNTKAANTQTTFNAVITLLLI